MDIFIKEPLLDWRKFAIAKMKTSKEDLSFSNNTSLVPPWYPEKKMDIARKKLELADPRCKNIIIF